MKVDLNTMGPVRIGYGDKALREKVRGAAGKIGSGGKGMVHRIR